LLDGLLLLQKKIRTENPLHRKRELHRPLHGQKLNDESVESSDQKKQYEQDGKREELR
jgi:hypothetical protein